MKKGNIIGGRYEVLSQLGQGGMGTVLLVRDMNNNEKYALKYCHIQDDASKRRFQREVRIISDVIHPNVLPIMDSNIENDPPYFVMPLADKSCEQKNEIYQRDQEQALSDFMQLCEGVQAIHNAGYIHRDIKPDNALSINGNIVVSDFGLVKELCRETTILTATSVVIGTMDYLAPEQKICGGSRDANQQSDIYQLGKTLYHFLTGQTPLLMDFDLIPPNLAQVIRKATQELPKNRYSSVGELRDAITDCVKANDPNTNPLRAFQSYLEITKQFLSQNQYNYDNVRNIFNILLSTKISSNFDIFIELFDSIPTKILNVLAKSHPDDLIPALQIYVDALDNLITDKSFAYAEAIASKMSVVFVNTEEETIKSLCLESVLLGAVRLHRFAAMDVFDSMLMQVQDDTLAIVIKDMLLKRSNEYKSLCDRIPCIRLHPLICELRTKITETNNPVFDEQVFD